MKQKNEKNKNDKIYRNYAFNQAGMLVQVVLVFCLLVFAVISIFNSEFMPAVTLVTGLTLLVMAYNNYRIYKRKSFTMLYIAIGVIVLIFGVLDLIG